MTAEYSKDFYAWTQDQAIALRTRNFAQLDIENLAEEIESMGRSERAQLENRLAVLLMHLLKWQYQSALRSRSWQATIKEQRRAIARHIQRNPSLQNDLDESFAEAYIGARIKAEGETDIPEENFPDVCSWTIEQVLDAGFYPSIASTTNGQ